MIKWWLTVPLTDHFIAYPTLLAGPERRCVLGEDMDITLTQGTRLVAFIITHDHHDLWSILTIFIYHNAVRRFVNFGRYLSIFLYRSFTYQLFDDMCQRH